jgi:hypothetical protein
LACVAQTCNVLFHPATDILWRTVESYDPLLKCLPKDYRHRPFQTEDLQRLDLYGYKIQVLHVETPSLVGQVEFPGQNAVVRIPLEFQRWNRRTNHATWKSWRALWSEITTLRPAPQFLPNIHRIRFNNVEEEMLLPLVGLSGSNLSYVRIVCLHDRLPLNIPRKILLGIKDVSKLEYLYIRDEGPDILPDELIECAPLIQLPLPPVYRHTCHKPYEYSKMAFGLRF